MHLLIGSLIWSGTRYVGEYRPPPPPAVAAAAAAAPNPLAAAMATPAEAAAADRGDPRGGGCTWCAAAWDMELLPTAETDCAAAAVIIILVVWSGEYIMPAAYMIATD